MKKCVYLLCAGLLIAGVAMRPTDDTKLPGFTHSQLKEILIPEKGGIIRGIHFNMSKEDVSHLEKGREYLNQKKYMAYTVPLSSAQYEFADVYYDFDKEGLFRVTIETYQDSELSSAKLFGAIKKYFDETIGNNYMADDGYLVWLSKDPASGLEYEIAMIDISTGKDAGIFLEVYVITE